MHRQSETRAGNHQRHTRTRNVSLPTQANNVARATNGTPSARPLYTHRTSAPSNQELPSLLRSFADNADLAVKQEVNDTNLVASQEANIFRERNDPSKDALATQV